THLVRVVRGDPADEVVIRGVAVQVLLGQLRLADAGHPPQHGDGLPPLLEQVCAQRGQQLFTAHERSVAVRHLYPYGGQWTSSGHHLVDVLIGRGVLRERPCHHLLTRRIRKG